MNLLQQTNTIKSIQRLVGVIPDGDAGSKTWAAIAKALGIVADAVTEVPKDNPSLGLSERAYNLILKYEVGGGQAYYNKCLKKPCYPGGASGVTIGIGYDLGYNSMSQFQSDWGKYLSPEIFNRLSAHLTKKSAAAKAVIGSVRDIEIPWDIAEKVFQESTLPRFINETKRAFPGSENLHPDTFGALVSLVFNRGGSLTGSSRKEMANIAAAIKSNRDNLYDYIADQISTMKRLWVGKGLPGLLTRRNEEAALVLSCK